jgi:CRP-like cAMP-binding protein
MDLKMILRQVEIFRGLDDVQLERILAISHEQTYDEGAAIFRQYDEGDAIFFIGSGQVEVQMKTKDGGTRAVIYLGEGQVFGEMALIDHGKRSASVLAIASSAIIYSIPTEDFLSLCASDTAIGFVIMQNIAKDLSFKLRHQNIDLAG